MIDPAAHSSGPFLERASLSAGMTGRTPICFERNDKTPAQAMKVCSYALGMPAQAASISRSAAEKPKKPAIPMRNERFRAMPENSDRGHTYCCVAT
jgi:hypothetical protein